jgi:hypothetical protein
MSQGGRRSREVKAKEDSDIWKMYQSKYWPSGFFGRGYIQLTWRKNYELWSKLTGVDLVSNPDAVLQPELSALILVKGMNEGAVYKSQTVAVYQCHSVRLHQCPQNSKRHVSR